ncbi:MAG: HAD-IC family P-type ATPase, partial [Clostridiales bacterium]|nr:HAD-IC family P-type ATPase [Clostridiales bacterium]
MEYYARTAEQTLLSVGSTPRGLTAAEAEERARTGGGNVLTEGKPKGIIRRLLEQFANPMIIVLIAASVISGVFGEHADMLIIFAVVAVNAVMGVSQEGKAERAVARLKAAAAPRARVRRDGSTLIIPASQLVRGDVVELEAGGTVAADMRILEANLLQAEEAALTGESVPVEKHGAALEGALALGDRKNMLFSSSKITRGTAVAVVTAIGMDTEVGRIADIIKNTSDIKTPLQRKMSEISRALSVIVLIICAAIFAVGMVWGKETPVAVFIKAVSIAVAAIPEGLAAVVTLVLALGVQRMSKRNAIIRKMNACETLGCVQYICSDKTGTLTQNKMTVTDVWFVGDFPGGAETGSGTRHFFNALVMCNNSAPTADGIIGDPTETALIAYAAAAGYVRPPNRRLKEFPFDSARKQMSTVNRVALKDYLYTKGAPDILISKCTHALIDGKTVLLTESRRAEILAANKRMASRALRVLAAAYREISAPEYADAVSAESGLTFLGLAGMIDPPRPEAKDAVARCARAGIKTVIITGDHPDTAFAVAKELGICADKELCAAGADLDGMTDGELQKRALRYRVYARVSPVHKMRIVRALQAAGNVVAMTGDGVNDAPALKAADV